MLRKTVIKYSELSDAALVYGAIRRDENAVREITTRNNQRLYRAAWSVLRNHADAEDAVQEGYLKAFTSLQSFGGQSSLSTWLTRIVLNVSLDRRRAAERRNSKLLEADIANLCDYRERFASTIDASSPEARLLRQDLARTLTIAVAQLPDEYRSVFVLRDIEEMSIRETAESLDLDESVVKTRLVRARRRLRASLEKNFKSLFADSLNFAGAKCAAMTERIVSALETLHPPTTISRHERPLQEKDPIQ